MVSYVMAAPHSGGNSCGERAQRDRIRGLLRRWARVSAFCAKKHMELDEYETLIESAADVHTQQLTGMPHGGETSDPTERAAMRTIKLKEVYEGRIDALIAEINEETRFLAMMDYALKSITYSEREIIDLRYKNELTFDEVAERTAYSTRRVQQLEKAAIDKLCECMPDEERR